MGPQSIDVATLAAVVATLVSMSCTWPQLARIRRTGDIAGVSVTAAALTVSSELGWTLYLGGEGLWAAVPEGDVHHRRQRRCLVVALTRCRRVGSDRPSWPRPRGWRAPRRARWLGGPNAIAVLLGFAYLVQLTPAVVKAWRTWSPSGIATATWMMRLDRGGAVGHVRLRPRRSAVDLPRDPRRRREHGDPRAHGRHPQPAGDADGSAWHRPRRSSRHSCWTMRWWGRSVSVVRNPSPTTSKPLAT